jgi:hypothetical protein
MKWVAAQNPLCRKHSAHEKPVSLYRFNGIG